MTRAELAKKVGISDDSLKAVFNAIKEEVKNGGKVAIDKFGSFEAVDRAPRTSRNPRTGEPVQVAAKKAPKFKSSSSFKNDLN